MFLVKIISLECHEIHWQLLHAWSRDFLKRLEPRNRQVVGTAAELVDGPDSRVNELKRVGLG